MAMSYCPNPDCFKNVIELVGPRIKVFNFIKIQLEHEVHNYTFKFCYLLLS